MKLNNLFLRNTIVNNPFKYGEIVKGEDFADRQNELFQLISDLRGSARIFLVFTP